MEYRRLLTLMAVAMTILGTSTALFPTLFALYTGIPITDAPDQFLALICQEHEQVKMSLVRLNGSMNLGVGLMAWVLRPIPDPAMQKRILMVFLVATAAGMGCVLLEQFSGTVTDYAKGAVVFDALVLLLMASGVWRLHRAGGREGL